MTELSLILVRNIVNRSTKLSIAHCFNQILYNFSMNGSGLAADRRNPYINGGYDPHSNQQTLGYGGDGVDVTGSGEFKYPHIQLRDVSCDVRGQDGRWESLLNSITLEARGGEILAILSTKGMHDKHLLYICKYIYIYILLPNIIYYVINKNKNLVFHTFISS